MKNQDMNLVKADLYGLNCAIFAWNLTTSAENDPTTIPTVPALDSLRIRTQFKTTDGTGGLPFELMQLTFCVYADVLSIDKAGTVTPSTAPNINASVM